MLSLEPLVVLATNITSAMYTSKKLSLPSDCKDNVVVVLIITSLFHVINYVLLNVMLVKVPQASLL